LFQNNDKKLESPGLRTGVGGKEETNTRLAKKKKERKRKEIDIFCYTRILLRPRSVEHLFIENKPKPTKLIRPKVCHTLRGKHTIFCLSFELLTE
jgi:hypothetical protein